MESLAYAEDEAAIGWALGTSMCSSAGQCTTEMEFVQAVRPFDLSTFRPFDLAARRECSGGVLGQGSVSLLSHDALRRSDILVRCTRLIAGGA